MHILMTTTLFFKTCECCILLLAMYYCYCAVAYFCSRTRKLRLTIAEDRLVQVSSRSQDFNLVLRLDVCVAECQRKRDRPTQNERVRDRNIQTDRDKHRDA